MNRYPVSGACFIRDSFRGAFMLPESLANALVVCDDVLIMDVGSTDGTLEFLREVERHNSRVHVIRKDFPRINPEVFADLANDLVQKSKHNNVFYWQSDEILHEGLFPLIEERFAKGEFDFSFWRIQYKENFQKIRWLPHIVHRIGVKGRFVFIGDGMQTSENYAVGICGHYDGNYLYRWSNMTPEEVNRHVNEMMTDVSKIGGFLENIIDRATLHGPFWNERPNVDGKSVLDWYESEKHNPNWRKEDSPFNLPRLLKWHLGKTRYQLRPELLEALKADKTREFLDL